MKDNNIVKVRVKAPYACFTHPALKVERMSYPCMTPSAARGVLESILWKPEFQWLIQRIKVLQPIKFASIKRNEVSAIVTGKPIDISDGSDVRAQRNSIILRDVEYIIEACIYMTEKNIQKVKERDIKDGKQPCEPIVKYRNMFNRRLAKGQCWHQPFLGTREFSCEFYEVTEDDEQRVEELNLTYPIGSILFDVIYDDDHNVTPVYMYDAVIRNGILECPEDLNNQMLLTTHNRAKRSEFVNQTLFELNKKEDGLC